tara:strand:+ start:566 stop:1129 length:564 start_codon:yes stop_codon:yes gene_type:complete
MSEIPINSIQKTQKQILASSNNNFQVELITEIGQEDFLDLIEISKYLVREFGNQALLTNHNIPKYFNDNTLPFIARHNGTMIGYIIGVPIENFKEEAWAQHDFNMGKNNTLYTYSFVVKEQYQRIGGYAKTLKKIYLNWAVKKKYKYITGHVKQGVAKKFSNNTQIVKTFPEWYGQKTPFEYYRRPL